MSRAPLSRATWLLIAGEAVSALGTGLVLPMTLIYLHQVRGIALPEVGALMAAIGAVGLVAVPLTGIALDRFGARPVLFATMLAGSTSIRPASSAFAINFTGINAGIGVGGAVGAAGADPAQPGSIQLLFLANAASWVIFAVMLIALPNVRPGHEADQPNGRYREVLANRPLRTALLAILALAFTGYAALDSGLPAYATVEAHCLSTL